MVVLYLCTVLQILLYLLDEENNVQLEVIQIFDHANGFDIYIYSDM